MGNGSGDFYNSSSEKQWVSRLAWPAGRLQSLGKTMMVPTASPSVSPLTALLGAPSQGQQTLPRLLDVTLVPPRILGSPGDAAPQGSCGTIPAGCRVQDSNGCLAGCLLAPQQPEPAAFSPRAQDQGSPGPHLPGSRRRRSSSSTQVLDEADSRNALLWIFPSCGRMRHQTPQVFAGSFPLAPNMLLK